MNKKKFIFGSKTIINPYQNKSPHFFGDWGNNKNKKFSYLENKIYAVRQKVAEISLSSMLSEHGSPYSIFLILIQLINFLVFPISFLFFHP